MINLYGIKCLLFLIGIRFTKKDFNKDYLSKQTTTIINGFFVLTIVFSHFKNTVNLSPSFIDQSLVRILNNIGQLMVTTFFFYSGYGIMESIKNKDDYIKNFFKRRVFPLWLNLAMGVALFLLVFLIRGQFFTIKQILLGFIGYEPIGNCNWFIFDTLLLYILTMICFNKKALGNKEYIRQTIVMLFLVLSVISTLCMFRPSRFVNTILCFPFGMLFCLYKPSVDEFFKKKYFIKFALVILTFITLFIARRKFVIDNDLYYNLYSMSFVSCIVVASMKYTFNNKVFEFLGKHVFWIYVLQMIPLTCLKDVIENKYILFISCLAITLISSYWMNRFSKWIFAPKKTK